MDEAVRNLVVLPTYNEAPNVERVVREVLSLDSDYGVLVVDDSSPDGTGTIVRRLADTYPGRVDLMVRSQKAGLGAAYRDGFEAACRGHARVVIQMDADGSHPVDRLPAMTEAVRGGAGLAIGSRYTAGGSVDTTWPWSRRMLSKGGNLYARLLLRLPVRDLTGGIKAWRRDVLAALDLSQANASGYAFQIQTTLQASLLPTTIVEVPIHFSERRAGTSKMTPGIALEAVLRVWTMRRHVRSAVSRSPEPTT